MFSDDKKQKWLATIARIRAFEDLLSGIYLSGHVRCPVHLAIGHEASAVGVCENLNIQDRVFGNHRSHHHYLAKGGSARELLLELIGSEDGCSQGRGGSTHLVSEKVGFMGSTAIIAGTLPVAAGYAHAQKLKNKNDIVVAFTGDASIEEGVTHEVLNMVSLWKLPFLLVIEDNDLSCYTGRSRRQAGEALAPLAAYYGLNYMEADGAHISNIVKTSENMILSAREGKPGILRVKVFRAHEHCGPDQDNHLSYRSVAGQWPDRDPLLHLMKELGSSGEKIFLEAKTEMKNLFKEVLKGEGFATDL